MPSKKQHGVRYAKQKILSYISDGKLENGVELPSLASFIKNFELSRVTIWKAFQELKAEGVVSGAKGHPFKVNNNSPQNLTSEPLSQPNKPLLSTFQKTAWHRIRDFLIKDIVDGAFRAGTLLPPNKDLERRYGACFRTLQKALISLSSEGTIIPHKKGYLLPAFVARSWKPRIICLSRTLNDTGIALPSNHDVAFMRGLELQCKGIGISVDIMLVINKPNTSEVFLRDARTKKEYALEDLATIGDPPIMGFIMLSPWEPGQSVHHIAAAIRSFKKPFIVLDGTGKVAQAAELGIPPKLVRIFKPTIELEPAKTVGRYLLSKGIQKSAFISASHTFLWSKKRLEGICQVYEAAGLPNAIESYTLENETELWSAKPPFETKILIDAYNRWKSTLPAEYHSDLDTYISQINNTLHGAHFRQQVYSLCHMACKSHIPEAFIAVNDETGVYILEYLKQHNIVVPHKTIVISFDNFEKAIEANLTSFDFNLEAVVQAALGFILGRKPFVSPSASCGYIISRASSNR